MISRKFKKVLFSVVSAVLCVTMILGVSASAAKNTVWSDTKALTSAKYNSNYIKWLEKYGEKEAKNTVSFSKSLSASQEQRNSTKTNSKLSTVRSRSSLPILSTRTTSYR